MNKVIDVSLTGHTKIIAHRGLSGLAPENSCEAFKLAGENGYYGIECDIHVTKDREFVVFHDATLERMTDSQGLIKDLTKEEIEKINIINGNGIENYQNVKIPFLSDYLTICQQYQAVPIIEIKEIYDTSDLDHLIQILKKFDLMNQAVVISFKLDYLIYLRMKESQLKMQYLVDVMTIEEVSTCYQYYMDIDANALFITEQNIALCHEHGIKVNVYTVDDPEIAKALNRYQIDYITSNILRQK